MNFLKDFETDKNGCYFKNILKEELVFIFRGKCINCYICTGFRN